MASASIVFSSDGSTEMVYHPKFQKTVDRYVIKPEEKEEELDINSVILGGSVNLARYIAQMQKKNELTIPKVSYGRSKFD